MNAHFRHSTNVLQTLNVKTLRVPTRVNVLPDICYLLISGHVMVSYLLSIKNVCHKLLYLDTYCSSY